MKVRLVRIGNSKGIRIPQSILELYRVREGSAVELETRREGILIRPIEEAAGKVEWETAYREMANEQAEREEWSAWDITSGDRLNG
jgi:antitoxin MazE